MMYGNYGMSYLGWGFGALILVGIAILVIVIVRVAMRNGGSATNHPTEVAPPPRPVTDAKRILDERYAKGELTTEEYRERLNNLGLGD
jgi:putative membrane protein